MGSLKDALEKAGLKASKKENDREKIKWKDTTKSVKHQHQRNYCEVCHTVQPDVERYIHKNPTVDAQWICSACADRSLISDETRVTNQSDFANNGTFRREFGATKKFNALESGHRKNTGKRDDHKKLSDRKYPGKRDDRREKQRANKNKDFSKSTGINKDRSQRRDK